MEIMSIFNMGNGITAGYIYADIVKNGLANIHTQKNLDVNFISKLCLMEHLPVMDGSVFYILN